MMTTKKRVFLTALTACLLFALAGCSKDPKIEPELTIDGHVVKLNETIKTATESGLTAVGSYDTPIEEMQPYGAMEFQYNTITITIPSDDGSEKYMRTGVTSYLFNDTKNPATVPNCKIGTLSYDVENESEEERADKEILINGINFKGMTAEEAFNAMMDLGFSKKQDDDLSFFILSSGDYYWKFTSEEGSDGQLYITKVELELKLNKKF